jgi:arylsulfatase A-like enzyme
MSAAYLAAVARMDHALGTLRSELQSMRDDTLLIALADHGGGGRVPTHHDSAHALDCTIPIFLEGAGVHPQELTSNHTILDVPATVLWALGLAIPDSYAGAPMHGAFVAPAQARLAATAA